MDWGIKFSADTSKVAKELKTFGEKTTIKIKVIPDKSGFDEVATTTKKTVNGLGDLVTVQEKVAKANGEIKSTTTTTTTELGKMTKQTESLGSSFVSTLGKVAKFYAVTQIIHLFTDAMGDSVRIVKEHDVAMTNLAKVSELSGDSLENYTKKLGEMGSEVARTRTEMTQSATVFKQGGYSDEDASVLSKVAELYRNVADSEVSSADSGAYLISQMKAFNITASDSISIIDKTNKLGNEFAISTSDISTALTKTASTFATYGNTIEETMGLVVGATELMPNQAGKVSKGLSSVGAEIVKLANDTGKLTYEVGNSVKTMNLFDESGKMLNTFSVLKPIASDWKNMSNAQQSAIALSLGMKTQIPVISALFNNFDNAIKATNSAMNASGSAMAENEKYMTSLKAKANLLKAEFVELVLGDGGINSLLKGLTTLGTGILKFANSDIGNAIVKISALSVAFGLLSKTPILFESIKKSAIGTKIALSLASYSGMGFVTTIKSITLAMLHNPLFMGMATVSGLLLFTKALNESLPSLEKYKEKIKELSDVQSTLQSEYDSLSARTDLTVNEQNRLDLINAQIKANKELIQTEYDKANALQKQQDGSNSVFVGSTKHHANTSDLGIDTEVASVDMMVQAYENLSKTKAKTLKQDDAIKRKKSEIIKALTEEGNAILENADKGITLSKYDKDRLNTINKLIKSTQKETSATNDSTNAKDNATQSFEEGTDATSETVSELDRLASSLNITTEELNRQAQMNGMSAESYVDMRNAIDDTNAEIDKIQSSYKVLENAVAEYNSQHYLSIDTLQVLSSLEPEYRSALVKTGNQLSINENFIRNKVIAQAEEAKQTIYNTAIAKLNAIANSDVSTSIANAGNSASNSKSGFISAAEGMNTLNAQMLYQLKLKKSLESGKNRDAVKGVASEVRAEINAINSEISNLGSNFEGSMGNAPHKKPHNNGGGGGGAGAGGGGSYDRKSAKSAQSTTDMYKAQYDKRADNLKHSLEMGYISENTYYKRLTNLNEKFFGKKSGHHKKYLSEYRKNEEEIYKFSKERYKADYDERLAKLDHSLAMGQISEKKYLSKLKRLDKKFFGEKAKFHKDFLDEHWRNEEKIYQKTKELQEDALNKQKDKFDRAIGYINGIFDRNIDRLQKKLSDLEDTYSSNTESVDKKYDAIANGIQSEIDSIERVKQAEQDRYDEQIRNLQSENDKINDQLELQEKLENLAKAKAIRVKIFKDGKFVYGQDEDAIASAQKDYDETVRKQEYNSKVELLQKEKDNSAKYYDEMLETKELFLQNTELLRKQELQVLEDEYLMKRLNFEREIQLEQEKQAEFNRQIEQSQLNADRRIAIQLMETDGLNKGWATQLANLAKFVAEWNALQSQIGGGGGGGGGKGGGGGGKVGLTGVISGTRYASSGNDSFDSDGLTVVGESPNSEIVIGSKLNQNGVLMNLSKGSGVVKANETKTLASQLSLMAKGLPLTHSEISNTKSVEQNFNFGKIDLPNVTNADDFVREISQNYKNYAIQESFK